MLAAASFAAPNYAANLRRLMAREALTLAALMRRSGLDHRTLKGILSGRKRPQPRTLHKLAGSFGVPVEELFQDAALLRHRLFDRQTNAEVEEVVQAHPRLFHGWTETEFDELHSHFGAGGALTPVGTVRVAEKMNRRRELLAKATLLLETSEAELLETMIEAMYRKVVIPPSNSPVHSASAGQAHTAKL